MKILAIDFPTNLIVQRFAKLYFRDRKFLRQKLLHNNQITTIPNIRNNIMSLLVKHETEECINQYTSSGQFQSADEVVLASLKLLEQRQQRLNKLRQQVEVGASQIATHQVIDGEALYGSFSENCCFR